MGEYGADRHDDEPRFPTVSPAAVAALRRRRSGRVGDHTIIGSVYSRAADDSAHGCPGQVMTDVYVGYDGQVYVGVSIWYECESYLETVADIPIPILL
jgi:hypothetical protein